MGTYDGPRQGRFSSTNSNYDVTFEVASDGSLTIGPGRHGTATDTGKTYGDDDPAEFEATVGNHRSDTVSYS